MNILLEEQRPGVYVVSVIAARQDVEREHPDPDEIGMILLGVAKDLFGQAITERRRGESGRLIQLPVRELEIPEDL